MIVLANLSPFTILESKLLGYQDIRAEGRQQGEANLILRLLKRRIGQVSPQLFQNIQSLSIEELENLGDTLFLLDFGSVEDLEKWFNQNL